MMPQEIIFILLLSSLQGTESITADSSSINITQVTSTDSISNLPTHKTERTVTTARTPNLSVTSSTAIKELTTSGTAVDTNTQTNNITPTSMSATSLLKTELQPTVSAKGVSHSSTSNSRMSPTLPISTTISSDLSTISKSYVTTPSVYQSETVSVNFTTAGSVVNPTTLVSTNKTQIDGITVPPTTVLPNVSTMPWTTKITSMTNLSTQTPIPHSSLIDNSSEAREPQKGHRNHGGVVFGAIVGAVLGCALISLVGYFLCGKRKSESFGHQRLYDDTRNDPVLRLDNAPEPYSANFGDLSYFNPPTTNETAMHDAIPMDDMTLSRLSP